MTTVGIVKEYASDHLHSICTLIITFPILI